MARTRTAFLFVDGVERLAAIQRFARQVPALCEGALSAVDVGWRAASGLVVLVVHHADPGGRVSQRLRFWAGAERLSARAVDGEGPQGDAAVRRLLALCDARLEGVDGQRVEAAASWLARAAGVAPAPAPATAAGHAPVLPIDLRDAGACAGFEHDPAAGTLRIPSATPPPPGDRFRARLAVPGAPVEEVGAAVLAGDAGGAGRPPGYLLLLTGASAALRDALAAWARRGGRRAAPRVPVHAPVRALDDAGDGDAPALENLSHGGAFIRTSRRWAAGTRLKLELSLPTGPVAADARVVHAGERGVGVRFELDAAGEARLGHAIALLESRPRRALVVDDDALVRRILSDALEGRGYEVLSAADGLAGLRVLADELLGLDVLVTDLAMPALDGEALIRRIRGAGGERDLAIVAVSGTPDADPGRLRAAGADAVVGKDAGADAIAAIADAALRDRAATARRVAHA